MIREYLTTEHKSCDQFLAQAESAIAAGDWKEAEKHLATFSNLTLLHFRKEEELLFPAFEERTGMTGGPTQVMRYEHDQIRRTLDEITAACETKNSERLLGLIETVMILIQQHNAKEEQVLYTMAERVLGPEAPALVDQMGAMA